MTYKDPWNGWFYRVSPAPDEDGLYHIEYRDPTSSAMFKLWPPTASAGCTMPESLEEVLAARAKKNGWVGADAPEPVEENAEPSPCNDWKSEQPDKAGCSCAGCKTPDCTCAGMQDAAGREECDGRENCAQDGCSYAAKHREPIPEAPAPVSAPDLPETAPAGFDYSGLDPETAEHLQNLARRAVSAKQRYILDMMEIVSEAHRELCGAVVARCDNSKHGNRGDETFRHWCASIGVGKDTAYRLLQVQALMAGSAPEEQEVLADAPAKLLYAVAKSSAPEELVQAVKDGDITTNKQYQEALAQLKAEREAREKADFRAEEAEQRAREVEAAAQSEHEGASALLADEQRRRQAAEQARNAAEGKAASAASSARAAEAQAKEATARIAALEKEREQHVQWLNDYQDQVDQLRDELCSRKPQQVEAQVVDHDELQHMAELAAVARVIESARESVEAILKRSLEAVTEVSPDIYRAIQSLTCTLADCYNAAYDVIEPPAEDAQDGEEAGQDDA